MCELTRYTRGPGQGLAVVGDGYLDGMHAWLSMYNDAPQSSEFAGSGIHCFLLTGTVDLEAESLVHSSGVIWTALNIDYPGHSFSHLGIFHGISFRLAFN